MYSSYLDYCRNNGVSVARNQPGLYGGCGQTVRDQRTRGVEGRNYPGAPAKDRVAERTASAPQGRAVFPITLTIAVEPGMRSPGSDSAPPPKLAARKSSARALKSVRFSGRAKPWPSSG